MFVVAGVTGQTGAAVAQALLDRNEPVRVLVRNERRGAPWRARGAEVVTLQLEDTDALASAFRGARGAYLIVPPAYEASDPNAAARNVVDVYHAALKRNPVPHAVLLSSIGAQHPENTGPILPCHYAEQRLRQLSDTRFTFLRSAYFMENLRNFMVPIQGQGVLPVLFSTSRRVAMVSVLDIGRIAADALSEGVSSHEVLEVSGPADPSFEDVAALFSRALGSPVKAVQVPEANIVGALTATGMPASTAELYRQMAVAVEAGLVAFERGEIRHAPRVRSASTRWCRG
jgi:uncharacterized protein YbjT (DUF2867 family)